MHFFPDPQTFISFTIGSLTFDIRWYAVLIMTGALLAYYVSRKDVALGTQDGRRIARGRRLAVGAGNLQRLEAEVGVAQLGQHVLDRLEHGADAKAQRRVQAVQRLVIRPGRNLKGKCVRHYAAFFPNART